MTSTTIFVDKDGVLIQNIPYNVEPEQISVNIGANPGLTRLYHAGYQLVVVSNQSGIISRMLPEEVLEDVENRLRDLLQSEAEVALAGFYYYPHHPQGILQQYALCCHCRTPQPGMILHTALEMNIDLKETWLIGDILDDIEAGRRAGCHTILLDNGNETEWVLSPYREPHFIVSDLREAARTILSILTTYDLGLSELPVE